MYLLSLAYVQGRPCSNFLACTVRVFTPSTLQGLEIAKSRCLRARQSQSLWRIMPHHVQVQASFFKAESRPCHQASECSKVDTTRPCVTRSALQPRAHFPLRGRVSLVFKGLFQSLRFSYRILLTLFCTQRLTLFSRAGCLQIARHFTAAASRLRLPHQPS